MAEKVGRNQPLKGLIKEGIPKISTYIRDEYGENASKAVILREWCRFVWFSVTHLTGPDDYYVNRLWRKSRREIKTFVTLRKMYKLRKIYNYGGDYDRFNDKTRFNTEFKEFIKRDWLDVDESSDEEIVAFASKHKKFICKPKASGGGFGIRTYEVFENVDVNDIRNKLKGYEVEELIKQHDLLSEINPYCANTFRITTIKEDDDVYIISAMFRCGTKDIPVDNWHQGGLTAAVDIDTGIVFTKGVQKLPTRREYLKHPVSGVTLIGFQMPFWEETKQMVYDMARKVDDVRLVGWDVAITNNGPCVVEGNHRGNTTILSVADDIGKYKIIKDIRAAHGRKMKRY